MNAIVATPNIPFDVNATLADLARHVAALHALATRLAAALDETDLVERADPESSKRPSAARPHPYLQAYLRLAAEYRHAVTLLLRHLPRPESRRAAPADTPADLPLAAVPDTQPESRRAEPPASRENAEETQAPTPDPAPAEVPTAQQRLDEAFEHRKRAQYSEAILAFNEVLERDPKIGLPFYDFFKKLEQYLPAGPTRPTVIPRATVDQIARRLNRAQRATLPQT